MIKIKRRYINAYRTSNRFKLWVLCTLELVTTLIVSIVTREYIALIVGSSSLIISAAIVTVSIAKYGDDK